MAKTNGKGEAKALRQIAEAIRKWISPLEKGDVRKPRDPLEIEVARESGKEAMRAVLEAERKAELAREAYSRAAHVAYDRVKSGLHLLTEAAGKYGCSALEQLHWLTSAVCDKPTVFVRYRERRQTGPDEFGLRRGRLMMSVLASEIERWADEEQSGTPVESAEHDLREREADVLEAMEALNAIRRFDRKTAKEIAKKTVGEADEQKVKAPLARLARAGYAGSLRGPNGGSWITKTGMAALSAYRKAETQ